MIFTAFLEKVENEWDLEMTDSIIRDANDPHDGAYNSVDYYNHTLLVNLVLSLHKKTGIPIRDLLLSFGRTLFGQLAEAHSYLIENLNSSFELLENIEFVIHTEVKKLYPKANPPTFDFERIAVNQIRMLYKSHRSMGDVAEGLMLGCADFFDENIQIERLAPVDGKEVFLLTQFD